MTGSWQDRGDGHVWLSDMKLGPDASTRLGGARWLTLTNVGVPRDFYSRLSGLVELEIDGGSAKDVPLIREATEIKRLALLRLRATDLGWITELSGLESLSLYSLPRIEAMPSLAGLPKLRFVQVGQMIRLHDVAGIAQAPALEELRFVKQLAVTAESMKPLVGHPTLARFGWWWDEGVSAAQGRAVLDALPLPRPDWDGGDIGAHVSFGDAD